MKHVEQTLSRAASPAVADMPDTQSWQRSTFTRRVELDDGEFALYNSYMGSLARVASADAAVVDTCLTEPFSRTEIDSKIVQQLCAAGFFVPADLAEREIANQVLDRERSSGLHLILLPHENCNFRCTYCYESFARGKMQPGVVDALKTFVGQKIEGIGELSVAWFGGEPLLARDVVLDLSKTFLEICEQHGARYASGMTTNGALLTPSVMDALLKSKVTAYQVTLDGPEALHDASRKSLGGQGTYQRILRNLAAAASRDDAFRIKIRVNFGTQHTPDLMRPFFDELSGLVGGDPRFDLHFHPMGRWGGPQDDKLEVCSAETASTRRTTLMQAAKQYGFPQGMARGHLRPHGNVCYAGKDNSMVIGSDGVIYKCTVAFEDPRNQVGQLRPDGTIDIDEEKWALWTKLDGKEDGKCASCSFSPTCQSRGCPLAAINQGAPPCPIPSAEINETIRQLAVSR